MLAPLRSITSFMLLVDYYQGEGKDTSILDDAIVKIDDQIKTISNGEYCIQQLIYLRAIAVYELTGPTPGLKDGTQFGLLVDYYIANDAKMELNIILNTALQAVRDEYIPNNTLSLLLLYLILNELSTYKACC